MSLKSIVYIVRLMHHANELFLLFYSYKSLRSVLYQLADIFTMPARHSCVHAQCLKYFKWRVVQMLNHSFTGGERMKLFKSSVLETETGSSSCRFLLHSALAH